MAGDEGTPGGGSDDRSGDMAARRRLRAALGAAELLPETTSDERPDGPGEDREQELLANLPPHHG